MHKLQEGTNGILGDTILATIAALYLGPFGAISLTQWLTGHPPHFFLPKMANIKTILRIQYIFSLYHKIHCVSSLYHVNIIIYESQKSPKICLNIWQVNGAWTTADIYKSLSIMSIQLCHLFKFNAFVPVFQIQWVSLCIKVGDF